MADPIEAFSAPFMQRALAEIAMLAALGGLLGTQIVLRRLAFFAHGAGGATFPGLVLAGPLGLPPALAALATSLAFAGCVERLGRWARLGQDAATALLLVAALGTGIVLASDVFASGSRVDQLLFGTLIGLGTEELVGTALALALVVLATLAFGRAWLAIGFDEPGARSLGLPVGLADLALVVAVVVAVVAALDAVGALLVTAVLVIPAATVRLFAPSVRALQVGAAALALVEGVAGLWLAYALDVPPGPAIAVLGGVVFALAALAGAQRRLAANARLRGAEARPPAARPVP